MNLARFNADDIHELRVQTAEKYRNMSPKEAERDFREHAANTRSAIEKIRRTKNERVM